MRTHKLTNSVYFNKKCELFCVYSGTPIYDHRRLLFLTTDELLFITVYEVLFMTTYEVLLIL